MKLSHLRTETRDDGSKYIAGQASYGIPAGSLVLLKRCDEHPGCYVLWTMEARKPRPDVSLAGFTGEQN